MQTNESNLTLATLIYATHCLEQGDWAVLRDLNFGEQEVKALKALQFSDFLSVAGRMDARRGPGRGSAGWRWRWSGGDVCDRDRRAVGRGATRPCDAMLWRLAGGGGHAGGCARCAVC